MIDLFVPQGTNGHERNWVGVLVDKKTLRNHKQSLLTRISGYRPTIRIFNDNRTEVSVSIFYIRIECGYIYTYVCTCTCVCIYVVRCVYVRMYVCGCIR